MLGVILSIFIGFWLLGIIGKFFLRFWLVKKQQQMEEQMRNGDFQGFGGFGRQSSRQSSAQRKEGEVTVEKQKETKTVSKKIGEYVDYEEV